MSCRLALEILWKQSKKQHFRRKITCLWWCWIRCPLEPPRQTLQPFGARFGSLCGQVHGGWPVRFEWSDKGQFQDIKIAKVLTHRIVWVPARTFSQNRINQKIELAGVELMEVCCMSKCQWGIEQTVLDWAKVGAFHADDMREKHFFAVRPCKIHIIEILLHVAVDIGSWKL